MQVGGDGWQAPRQAGTMMHVSQCEHNATTDNPSLMQSQGAPATRPAQLDPFSSPSYLTFGHTILLKTFRYRKLP